MITTLHQLLERAERRRYAIPACNVTNLESAQAVIAAAAKLKSPVIVQTSEAAIAYAGHTTLLSLIEHVAAEQGSGIPIVTHLDHGKHFRVFQKSVRLGFTSVHMDASDLPFGRNVAVTKKAVALGHRHGITVQGELGTLLGFEGMLRARASRAAIEQLMTDPVKAGEFVRKTGVDTLAIAVGTAHGQYPGRERIDFKRLAAIRAFAKVPLVLHGGSGVPAAELKRAIQSGIRIINIDTVLRIRFMEGLARALRGFTTRRKVDLRAYLARARRSMEQEVERVIRSMGAAGKAKL